ncbi:ABC transporter, permease protein [Aeropyrum pernix K1]|uniref:ABC transporter, permease protein n=1 Tax=Aeropyrum pernix (strain ATCC 700893 / DSM 11879 / JCM 9820 / NBRC 100138 / K1) TaxID=272557 RepID=Q9YG36_AERPE|nr:ABC transporter permease [Aeropyrum pernix]BAA78974.1 ABC transporter, permease protein [Aeropyrum pernix K1]
MRRTASIGVAVLSTIIAGIMLSFIGPGPAAFVEGLIKAATTPSLVSYSVIYAAILVAAASGLVLSYRAGLITIGVEAQVTASAVAALYALAYAGLGLPGALTLAAIVSLAIGIVIAALRVYLDVNEILSSLMINYIVLYMVNGLVSGPLREGAFTKTRSIEAFVGPLEAGLAAVSMAALSWILLERTSLGISLRASGPAPRAADIYTIGRARAMLLSSLPQSLAAAAAGLILLGGIQTVFTALKQPQGYGYAAVLVSWMAELSPTTLIPVSLFFAWIAGAGFILQAYGMPSSLVLLLQSIALTVYMVARRL